MMICAKLIVPTQQQLRDVEMVELMKDRSVTLWSHHFVLLLAKISWLAVEMEFSQGLKSVMIIIQKVEMDALLYVKLSLDIFALVELIAQNAEMEKLMLIKERPVILDQQTVMTNAL